MHFPFSFSLLPSLTTITFTSSFSSSLVPYLFSQKVLTWQCPVIGPGKLWCFTAIKRLSWGYMQSIYLQVSNELWGIFAMGRDEWYKNNFWGILRQSMLYLPFLLWEDLEAVWTVRSKQAMLRNQMMPPYILFLVCVLWNVDTFLIKYFKILLLWESAASWLLPVPQ